MCGRFTLRTPLTVLIERFQLGMNAARQCAAELAKRQKPDGSWANPADLVREDEPLVATANAVIALANYKAAPAAK